MNGIEALYKTMEDPELESRFYEHGHFTFKERIKENHCFYLDDLNSDNWQIRKRQSNLDKAVDELSEVFIGGATTAQFKEILSKYIKD